MDANLSFYRAIRRRGTCFIVLIKTSKREIDVTAAVVQKLPEQVKLLKTSYWTFKKSAYILADTTAWPSDDFKLGNIVYGNRKIHT